MTMALHDLQPIVHQHVALLEAGGHSPAEALSLACHAAVLVYDEAYFREALEMAANARGNCPALAKLPRAKVKDPLPPK